MNINATLLGEMITFALFVWFTMKYVWPPVITALRERQQKIADGLAAAERGAQELEAAKADVDQAIAEAKQQAAVVLDSANKRANQIVEEAKDAAREEGERLITAAKAEIDQQVNQAREALRSQVAALAVSGAEQILKSSIDEKAHSELLNKLVAEL
ncbi:F0F1 ATP synthase subunit B [Pelagibaculum spongiae]|uniref:ATP synthase subunit b n=1 Tax=Pelagibaculum spongiae TaxID=2080658 RepID=A0A2V1GUV2_9GAMM|nr:F0F1 ATP synthase subunit B [Pelagibaculum spongiae]PVZ68121.1 F0F1 ATP synthase subunit B [Pelagibaculum spongiae]